MRRAHGITLSYRYVKQALQPAGLLRKRQARGRHRRRREPKACFGELLHLDGRRHPWFALDPDQRATLITVVDDATSALVYAQLWAQETMRAVMSALADGVRREGLPMALSTDRAAWAFYTPTATGPVDKSRITQVGRALRQLGIAHIPAYSPQARGRSERMNRTLQGRLGNEFRVARIRTVPQANAYLRKVYLPQHNATFRRPPRAAATAFTPLGGVDLDTILCQEDERIVAPDNTITVNGRLLQIEPLRGRRTCAGLHVRVRQHLDGRITVSRPPDIPLTYTLVTSSAMPVAPKRTHRRVIDRRGTGRWPKTLKDRFGNFL